MNTIRRHLRFSTRTLLAVAIMLTLFAGFYFESIRDGIEVEGNVQERISDSGGETYRVDYRPAWLEKLFDQDLANITVVHLEKTSVADGDLVSLVDLPKLGGLHLSDTHISDASFADINRLKGLVQLDLSRTNVHQVVISDLPLLEDLSLRGNRIAHLRLAGAPKLRSLDLGFTDIDDDGLRQLQEATNLETLDLRNSAITDAGLAHLSALPNLKTVYVYETGVTEDGSELLRARRGVKVIGYRSR